MKRNLAARHLSRMTLYTFFAVLFFLGIWLIMKNQEDMYDYYYTMLTVLFRTALICVSIGILSLLFSLYDIIVRRQARAAGTIVLHLLFTLTAAGIGVYASVLQTLY